LSGFDLAARRPVWLALAELFLDTDVRFGYVAVAAALAESTYSLEELRRILDDEVTPALQGNLLQMAGEWAGFDEEWMVEQVSARVGKRRWLPAFVNTSPDWRAVAGLVSLLRALPDDDARKRRASAWRALLPLFLMRDLRTAAASGCSVKEEALIFREELWPLMIESVRALADGKVYPDEADVEANWSRWSGRLTLPPH
jgi:hypothetical protein